MDAPDTPQTNLEKKRILDSSRDLIINWVTVHFEGYLGKLSEQLFRLSDNANNNEDQARYFQAQKEINAQQQLVHNIFIQRVGQAFSFYCDGKQTATDFNLSTGDEENLSLIDQAELEEAITIASMSRKASANASEDLYILNQRLSALKGGEKISEQGNPVAPAVFSEAIHKAITDLALDNRSKLIVYKVFDSVFLHETLKLYNLLNHHLETHGLLPNLHYQIKKDPNEVLPEELHEQISEVSIATQQALIEAIERILAELRPQRPAPTGPLIPIAQLIAGIQQLQSDASSQLAKLQTPQDVAGSNSASFKQQTDSQASQAKDIDSEVVEIVGLLFEYMLNDEQLPDSVKALLSYLHTPVVKVALLDKDFFNHPQHPARQLLNTLVAAGERWVEPHGKHKSDVFHKIKSIVQRILDEFNNDIRLFSELAFDFNQYLRQHTRRIRLAEKRAMQAAQGESKLKTIRLKVEAFLEQKTAGFELPKAVKTLLFEPWSNFLCFNLLRFGSKSPQWQKAAHVVDDLIWYTLMSGEWHDEKRVAALRNDLPSALQSGFEVVGYDKGQSTELLIAMHQCHQHMAEQSPTPYLPKQQPALAGTDIDDIDISQRLSNIDSNDPLIEKLKRLETGTWFIFNADEAKQQRRVKLAWSDPNTLHFMFVNRMGQQVAMKTGAELITGIRAKRIKVLRVLEGKPFFEKALKQVLHQYQNQEKH